MSVNDACDQTDYPIPNAIKLRMNNPVKKTL